MRTRAKKAMMRKTMKMMGRIDGTGTRFEDSQAMAVRCAAGVLTD